MTARYGSHSSSAAPHVEVDVESIWRDHADGAVRYATVLVGANDAHDVVADSFVRISQSPGWGGIDHPRAYLLRAVTNRASDVRRQQTRRSRRELTTFEFQTSGIPEPTIDLRRQIAALSVQQRAVIFLTYWEDMTVPAIADLLGLSAGTVHRHLTRARTHLRKALQ
jgi:RNA polymerase sigma factor (sigma-70 family)